MKTTPIEITENTSVSARYLPFHSQCTMEPCGWGANFATELDAERSGLRHHCEGKHMQGKTITQLITDEADEKYDEWATVYETEAGTPSEKFKMGQLQGLCIALAIIRNPYNPDPQDVAKSIQERGDGRAASATE